MKNTFVILWAPGAAWTAGKTVREQAYWDEHAEFMDRLFENGTVIMGGPFSDGTGSLVIVEAVDMNEVSTLFAKDPFVVHQIFALRSLKQWQLFLDARRSVS
jgi:uncharacterized protein YciI